MTGERPRTPRLPEPVGEWIERYAGVSVDGDPLELRDGAVRALREALRRPGMDREGAHALLAADALLTYVVEDLANADDPDAGLRSLLELVVGLAREEAV